MWFLSSFECRLLPSFQSAYLALYEPPATQQKSIKFTLSRCSTTGHLVIQTAVISRPKASALNPSLFAYATWPHTYPAGFYSAGKGMKKTPLFHDVFDSSSAGYLKSLKTMRLGIIADLLPHATDAVIMTL